MKKIILIAIFALTSLFLNAQSDTLYKNIQINQSVTFQGSTINSCYAHITLVQLSNLCNMSAYYQVKVYENKAKYDTNKNWTIAVTEVPSEVMISFTPDFNQGDLFLKVSEALKTKLLELNPTWNAENLIIE